jgi:hypothetical protein
MRIKLLLRYHWISLQKLSYETRIMCDDILNILIDQYDSVNICCLNKRVKKKFFRALALL